VEAMANPVNQNCFSPPLGDERNGDQFSMFNGSLDSDFITACKIGHYTPEYSNSIIGNIHSPNLLLLHINIRSLNANYNSLLDLLATYDSKFDIILLSEIWSTNISFFDNVFLHYNFVPVTPANQHAGGVACLVKNSISIKLNHLQLFVICLTL
jgi:hypothetical protein